MSEQGRPRREFRNAEHEGVPMSGALLAFDSSTEALAVALRGPAERRVWNGPGGAQASVGLLPQVQRLLAQAELGLHDLTAIAFGRGPGAFTGLRTACSVAQGLALGAGVPVIAIDSLLIVAEDARLQDADTADVGVVMDARMGELYAARYTWANGDWHVRFAPCLVQPQDLARRWQAEPPAVLAGTGVAMLGGRIPCQFARPEQRDRATALLQLAERLQVQGRAVDADQALPVYLRDKVAQTTAERQALAGATP
jgi:tRNA threonylcarbamoyladenosine biosynthesis protein TsaB